jgi:hypothetical protein
VFVEYPVLAAVMAAGCGGLWLWRRGRASAIAALSWLLYAIYEFLMKARVLCSGECNIRVDLLVIYPFLIVVSAATLIASIRMLVEPSGKR